MNGTGAYNQASDTAQSLKSLGFNIGTEGDVDSVGQYSETVVYYSSKTPSELAAAQAVADSMSGAVIMADDASQVQAGSQVTVVTGSDFTVNPPPAQTTPTSAGATTTPTTAAASSNTGSTGSGTTGNSGADSGAFQPPTSTVTPLAPWDPRACTASGGEGT